MLDDVTTVDYNGITVSLASGATLTVTETAWPFLSSGLVIKVGQSAPATLAFSGGATKENASGTSAESVSLVACGTYTLTQSPSGAPIFHLHGGAAL